MTSNSDPVPPSGAVNGESNSNGVMIPMANEVMVETDQQGCHSCHQLQEQLLACKKEQAFYSELKKKIVLTDALIRRYNTKCQEYDLQQRKVDELTRKLASSKRDCKLLEEQLAKALKEIIPWKREKTKFMEEYENNKRKLVAAQDALIANQTGISQYNIQIDEQEKALNAQRKETADAKNRVKHLQQVLDRRKSVNVEDYKNEIAQVKKEKNKISTSFEKAKLTLLKLKNLLHENNIHVPRVPSQFLPKKTGDTAAAAEVDLMSDNSDDSMISTDDEEDNTANRAKPATQLKPSTQVKPLTRAKTSSQVQPSNQVKPSIQVKSSAKVKPSTRVKPTSSKPQEKEEPPEPAYIRRIQSILDRKEAASISTPSTSTSKPGSSDQKVRAKHESSSEEDEDNISGSEMMSHVADEIDAQLNLTESDNDIKQQPKVTTKKTGTYPGKTPIRKTYGRRTSQQSAKSNERQTVKNVRALRGAASKPSIKKVDIKKEDKEEGVKQLDNVSSHKQQSPRNVKATKQNERLSSTESDSSSSSDDDVKSSIATRTRTRTQSQSGHSGTEQSPHGKPIKAAGSDKSPKVKRQKAVGKGKKQSRGRTLSRKSPLTKKTVTTSDSDSSDDDKEMRMSPPRTRSQSHSGNSGSDRTPSNRGKVGVKREIKDSATLSETSDEELGKTNTKASEDSKGHVKAIVNDDKTVSCTSDDEVFTCRTNKQSHAGKSKKKLPKCDNKTPLKKDQQDVKPGANLRDSRLSPDEGKTKTRKLADRGKHSLSDTSDDDWNPSKNQKASESVEGSQSARKVRKKGPQSEESVKDVSSNLAQDKKSSSSGVAPRLRRNTDTDLVLARHPRRSRQLTRQTSGGVTEDVDFETRAFLSDGDQPLSPQHGRIYDPDEAFQSHLNRAKQLKDSSGESEDEPSEQAENSTKNNSTSVVDDKMEEPSSDTEKCVNSKSTPDEDTVNKTDQDIVKKHETKTKKLGSRKSQDVQDTDRVSPTSARSPEEQGSSKKSNQNIHLKIPSTPKDTQHPVRAENLVLSPEDSSFRKKFLKPISPVRSSPRRRPGSNSSADTTPTGDIRSNPFFPVRPATRSTIQNLSASFVSAGFYAPEGSNQESSVNKAGTSGFQTRLAFKVKASVSDDDPINADAETSGVNQEHSQQESVRPTTRSTVQNLSASFVSAGFHAPEGSNQESSVNKAGTSGFQTRLASKVKDNVGDDDQSNADAETSGANREHSQQESVRPATRSAIQNLSASFVSAGFRAPEGSNQESSAKKAGTSGLQTRPASKMKDNVSDDGCSNADAETSGANQEHSQQESEGADLTSRDPQSKSTGKTKLDSKRRKRVTRYQSTDSKASNMQSDLEENSNQDAKELLQSEKTNVPLRITRSRITRSRSKEDHESVGMSKKSNVEERNNEETKDIAQTSQAITEANKNVKEEVQFAAPISTRSFNSRRRTRTMSLTSSCSEVSNQSDLVEHQSTLGAESSSSTEPPRRRTRSMSARRQQDPKPVRITRSMSEPRKADLKKMKNDINNGGNSVKPIKKVCETENPDLKLKSKEVVEDLKDEEADGEKQVSNKSLDGESEVQTKKTPAASRRVTRLQALNQQVKDSTEDYGQSTSSATCSVPNQESKKGKGKNNKRNVNAKRTRSKAWIEESESDSEDDEKVVKKLKGDEPKTCITPNTSHHEEDGLSEDDNDVQEPVKRDTPSPEAGSSNTPPILAPFQNYASPQEIMPPPLPQLFEEQDRRRHLSPVSPIPEPFQNFDGERSLSPLPISPSETPPIMERPLSALSLPDLPPLPPLVTPLPPSPLRSLLTRSSSRMANPVRMVSPLTTPPPRAISPLPQPPMPDAISPLKDDDSMDSVQHRLNLIPSPRNFHAVAPRHAVAVPPHPTGCTFQAARCLTGNFDAENDIAGPSGVRPEDLLPTKNDRANDEDSSLEDNEDTDGDSGDLVINAENVGTDGGIENVSERETQHGEGLSSKNDEMSSHSNAIVQNTDDSREVVKPPTEVADDDQDVTSESTQAPDSNANSAHNITSHNIDEDKKQGGEDTAKLEDMAAGSRTHFQIEDEPNKNNDPMDPCQDKTKSESVKEVGHEETEQTRGKGTRKKEQKKKNDTSDKKDDKSTSNLPLSSKNKMDNNKGNKVSSEPGRKRRPSTRSTKKLTSEADNDEDSSKDADDENEPLTTTRRTRRKSNLTNEDKEFHTLRQQTRSMRHSENEGSVEKSPGGELHKLGPKKGCRVSRDGLEHDTEDDHSKEDDSLDSYPNEGDGSKRKGENDSLEDEEPDKSKDDMIEENNTNVGCSSAKKSRKVRHPSENGMKEKNTPESAAEHDSIKVIEPDKSKDDMIEENYTNIGCSSAKKSRKARHPSKDEKKEKNKPESAAEHESLEGEEPDNRINDRIEENTTNVSNMSAKKSRRVRHPSKDAVKKTNAPHNAAGRMQKRAESVEDKKEKLLKTASITPGKHSSSSETNQELLEVLEQQGVVTSEKELVKTSKTEEAAGVKGQASKTSSKHPNVKTRTTKTASKLDILVVQPKSARPSPTNVQHKVTTKPCSSQLAPSKRTAIMITAPEMRDRGFKRPRSMQRRSTELIKVKPENVAAATVPAVAEAKLATSSDCISKTTEANSSPTTVTDSSPLTERQSAKPEMKQSAADSEAASPPPTVGNVVAHHVNVSASLKSKDVPNEAASPKVPTCLSSPPVDVIRAKDRQEAVRNSICETPEPLVTGTNKSPVSYPAGDPSGAAPVMQVVKDGTQNNAAPIANVVKHDETTSQTAAVTGKTSVSTESAEASSNVNQGQSMRMPPAQATCQVVITAQKGSSKIGNLWGTIAKDTKKQEKAIKEEASEVYKTLTVGKKPQNPPKPGNAMTRKVGEQNKPEGRSVASVWGDFVQSGADQQELSRRRKKSMPNKGAAKQKKLKDTDRPGAAAATKSNKKTAIAHARVAKNPNNKGSPVNDAHIQQTLTRIACYRMGTNANNLVERIAQNIQYNAMDLLPVIYARCLANNTSTQPVLTPVEEKLITAIVDWTKKNNCTTLVECLLTFLHQAIQMETLISPSATAKQIPKEKKFPICSTFCRLYSILCLHTDNLQCARVFAYDLLRNAYPSSEHLILAVAASWPAVLYKQESTQASPVGSVIETVVMQRLSKMTGEERTQQAFTSLCGWRPHHPDSIINITQQLVAMIQDANCAQLINENDPNLTLNQMAFEVSKAMELLAFSMGWEWTNNILIRDHLWPVLKKWTLGLRSESSIKNGSACLVMKIIAIVGIPGLAKNKTSVSEVMRMLLAVLQQPSEIIPWCVQLYTADAILQLSASRPTLSHPILEKWSSEASQRIPASLTEKIKVLGSWVVNTNKRRPKMTNDY